MFRRKETVQKRAVKRIFAESAQPLKAVEAHEHALRYAPTLGMATLYRVVRELEEEGWLKAVNLPGDTVRYERADKDHHHHFQCRACRGVYEIEGCPNGLSRMAPSGFQVEAHEVTLYGLCSACNTASAP